jgi:ABC-2 type transport system ATP-binding protein
MLDLVGLTDDEAGRRLRHYSLGMRQRLGIAQALLPDPQVLVLDEPANGLDPQGIHWMRGLLAGFAAQGRTVLLFSHLLHEVELVADELVLIGRGRIVAQGSKASLLAGSGVLVTCEDPDRLRAALVATGLAVRTVEGSVQGSDYAGTPGGVLSVEADGARVGRVALAAGVVVSELRPAEGTGLEQLFLDLTSGTDRSQVAA